MAGPADTVPLEDRDMRRARSAVRAAHEAVREVFPNDGTGDAALARREMVGRVAAALISADAGG